MSIDRLRKEVYEANMELVSRNLVISTWGNVSGYDEENNIILIKPSGVPYSELKPEMIVPVDMDGQVVEGEYRPSTDTLTHIVLYKAFAEKGIKGVVHTHSTYGTIWAQMARDIPCYGTTHADYFYGDIPCARILTEEEIDEGYELNTGKAILEAFEYRDPVAVPGILAHSHAPFAWGDSPKQAVLHAQVLENVAKMALFDYIATNGEQPRLAEYIKNKHHLRKFGPNAYYGQKNK